MLVSIGNDDELSKLMEDSFREVVKIIQAIQKIPIPHRRAPACPNIPEKDLLTRTAPEVMMSSSLTAIPAEG